MLKAKKEIKKVAITFRVSSELYERYQSVKQLSRTKGYIFTLQDDIEKFLEKHIKEAEIKLRNMDDIKIEDKAKESDSGSDQD